MAAPANAIPLARRFAVRLLAWVLVASVGAAAAVGWVSYENAQRIDELGFGVRLNTYGFADAELTDAVERLLGDAALRSRLAEQGEAIRARDGLRVGADVIEQIGAKYRASLD